MSHLQELGTRIVRRLVDAGHTAYFAGGWVRDYLLGLPSDDIDIATSASPEEVQKIFSKTIPVGAAFGVVMVLEQGVPFEVASFRADGLYIDGRHPESVRYSTPQEDAQRRDFTINGMFFDPIKQVVHDYVGGQEDLLRKVVRAIGEPAERFREDRLRMVRAVRLVGRFGFALDPATEQAIVQFADQLFPSVAVERIWQELVKMSKYPGFSGCLRELYRLKLLATIFPDLREEPAEAILQRILAMNDYLPQTPTIVFVGELLGSIPLDRKLAVCTALKVSKEDQRWVEYLERGRSLSDDPVAWVHWYADPRSQTALQVIAPDNLEYHHRRQEKWSHCIARVRERQPLITGQNLMNAGVRAGPSLGKLLYEAERLSIVNGITDMPTLFDLLKSSTLWKEATGE